MSESSSLGRFEGRVAIVTGASRGIGLAIAQRLAAEGARVCITARKIDALTEATATIGTEGQAIFSAGRADDVEHQQATVSQVLDTFGRLDVLINNTGINPSYGPLLELTPEAGRKITDVNLLGTLGWVKAARDAWLGEHGGSIVNVASVAGMRHAHGIGFYGASKAALMHMTMQLGVELAPTIRVNAVAPAVVKTKFATALYEDREDEVAAHYPLRRLGLPEDIAGGVAYLASDDASWVTGQTLVIDGGLLLGGGI